MIMFNKHEKSCNGNIDMMFEEPACCVCGKTFRSMKSLFGHMRSHPGRQWPLSNNDVAINHDGCGNKGMGLGFALGTWSKKARRSGKGITGGSGDGGASSGSNEEEVEDEEEKKLRNAVHDLLMLKELNSFQATTSHHDYVTNTCRDIVLHESMSVLEKYKKDEENKKRRRSVGEDDDSPKSMLTTQVISSSTGYGGEKVYCYPTEDYNVQERGSTLLLGYFENEWDGGKAELGLMNETNSSSSSNNNNNNNNTCSDGENNNKKKLKLMVMNSEYKCSACNKCFKSHQALGGHVSSHNKLKKNSMIMNQQHHVQDLSTAPLHCESVHACKICNKTFASGQSLGGHMRCHWPGPILQFAQEPSAYQAQLAPTFPGEEVNQNAGSRREVLFDLNELPPVEEDIITVL